MRFLHLYALVAFERLQTNEALRHGDRLDELMQRYAETYRYEVDLETCASVHRHCAACLAGFVATVRLPEVKV